MGVKSSHRKVQELLTKHRGLLSDKDFFKSKVLANTLEDISAVITKRYGNRRRLKITVDYDKNGEHVAFTTNRNTYINAGHPLLNGLNRQDRYKFVLGLLGHELGHNLFTDFICGSAQQRSMLNLFKWLDTPVWDNVDEEIINKKFWDRFRNEVVTRDFFFKIYNNISNIVEDGYVEEMMFRNWPGSLASGLRFVRNKDWKEMLSIQEMIDGEESPIDELGTVLMMLKMYSKYGTFKYGNVDKSDERLQAIISCMSCVNEAMQSEAKKREENYAHIFIKLYPFIEKCADEILDQANQQANQQQGNNSGASQQQQQNAMNQAIQQIMQNCSSSEAGSGDTEEVGDSQQSSANGKQTASEKNRQKTSQKMGVSGNSSSSQSKSQPSQKSENNSNNNANAKSSKSSKSAKGSEDENDEDGSAGGSGDSETDAENENGADNSNDTSEEGDTTGDGGGSSEDENSDEDNGSGEGEDEGDGEDGFDTMLSEEDSDGDSDGNASPASMDTGTHKHIGGSHHKVNTGDFADDDENGDGGVEFDDDFEAEFDANAGADMERMLEEIALGKATAELEDERLSELNHGANDISYGNIHRGVKIKVHRQREIEDWQIEQYEQNTAKLIQISKQLRRAVESQIKDSRTGGRCTGLLSGRRFNGREAYRLDGCCFAKNKLPEDVPRLAVGLLIDESGSMSGRNQVAARATAIVLEDFCRSLDIPITIYGHSTSGYSDVDLFSYVEFDSYDNNDKYRLMNIGARNCNRDGCPLRYVAEKLMERPEEAKVLILISDGQPNGSGYGGESAYADLRGIKHEYTRKGVCFVAAAIDEDKEQIQEIYGDSFLDITNLEELPQTLTKVLKTFIKTF